MLVWDMVLDKNVIWIIYAIWITYYANWITYAIFSVYFSFFITACVVLDYLLFFSVYFSLFVTAPVVLDYLHYFSVYFSFFITARLVYIFSRWHCSGCCFFSSIVHNHCHLCCFCMVIVLKEKLQSTIGAHNSKFLTALHKAQWTLIIIS